MLVATRSLCRLFLRNPGTSTEIPRRMFTIDAESSSSELDSNDVTEQMEKLQPSEEFKNSLDALQLKKLNKILPEIEIFAYMAQRSPTELKDKHWNELIGLKNVKDRVHYLEYVTLIELRQKRDIEKKELRHQTIKRIYDEEQEKYDRGEMGYGPGMYQLVMNPFRNQKNINKIEGSRVWTAMRIQRPKVIFDMQYIMKEHPRDRKILLQQLEYTISENLETRTPLHLTFANVPQGVKELEFMKKIIGHYEGGYNYQTILPDLNGEGVKEIAKTKNIVYISKYARATLDGPLRADAYVICPTMDLNRQSLGAATRDDIRVFRFPINRYVDWKSGPQYIPYPNMIRIMRHVYMNNGDWKTALNANVAKRHLLTAEEREEKSQAVSRRKLRVQAREELITSIRDATGND